MTKLSLTIFVSKHDFKQNTRNKIQLKSNYNFPIYQKDFKLTTNKGFVNIDDGSMGETYWTCLFVKVDKSY